MIFVEMQDERICLLLVAGAVTVQSIRKCIPFHLDFSACWFYWLYVLGIVWPVLDEL